MTCECARLNSENDDPGTIIMCDACVLEEIRRLDAYHADGRTGYICDKCGSPSWEPQGATTCAECRSGRTT